MSLYGSGNTYQLAINMPHFHISLVGGQPMPVYQGIIHCNPDKVLLVCSDRTYIDAQAIKEELKGIDITIREFDPVDIELINKQMAKLEELIPNDACLSVNITGGTKPWSILFYNRFIQRATTTLLYIDQNNKLWNFSDGTDTMVNFDLDAQFRLNGNALVAFNTLESYSNCDIQAIFHIKSLRKLNHADFNKIISYLQRFSNENQFTTKGGSFIEWLPNEKAFNCFIQNQSSFKEIKLKSKNIRNLLLNTGWFELEVALLLSKWSKSKDIRLNCRFPARTKGDKNEIDIVVNMGNKILFVECKTQIYDMTDIDKFASAVKVYGGLGSKMLFITESEMKEKAIEKCNDHGIMFFSLQNNLNLEITEKLLFSVLDNELLTINAR